MPDRQNAIETLLTSAGWQKADRQPLAGDASNRRYDRLALNGRTAVLMDAPPDKGEDIVPFIRVASYLRGLNFSAPKIIASDPAAGLLLLEDLGDRLYSRVLHPGNEDQLYSAATDLLVALHRAAPPRLPAYGPAEMAGATRIIIPKYRDLIANDRQPDLEGLFSTRMYALLTELGDWNGVAALRDYHADNLLWLPERTGLARVGLLDFQDAVICHPAYDLVSMLQDARRDVPEWIEDAMIARYVSAQETDEAEFRRAYAAMGTQRHLRILGIFGRLGTDYGKPGYLDLIPRVWAMLMRNLAHPDLAEIARLVADTLPAPGSGALSRLHKA